MTGKKLRLYLDTTIPNYLFADDTPERREYTLRLWDRFVVGEFEIFVSDVFFAELEKCPQPKLGWIDEKMSLIQFKHLQESDEVNDLALEYINNAVLTNRRLNDCLHIAYAVVNDCDVILSWNFDDMVNDRTRGKVKVVNAISRYKEIGIVSPEEFLKGGYR